MSVDLKSYLLLKQMNGTSGTVGGQQIQVDWNQEDKTKVDFIKNKPNILSNDEFLQLCIDEDMFPAVTDENQAFLSDENGNILLW